MSDTKIIINRIKCLKCGDIITSESVHDFKYCSCQSCAVDGGNLYLRRIGNPEEWEDLSVVETIEGESNSNSASEELREDAKFLAEYSKHVKKK